MWRRFCRISLDASVPDSTTLIKLVKRCGADTINQLNDAVIEKLRDEKFIRARRLRVDSTVVEANIHYPTDASLIHDGIRCITRTVRQLKAQGLATTTSFRDRSRSAKSRLLEIAKLSRRRTQEAITEVRQITGKMANIADHSLHSAKQVLEAVRTSGTNAKDSAATAAQTTVRKLQATMERLEQAVDQAREVNSGNLHLPDRLVSIFDPDARPIRKGKMKAPTEFGYKLSLGESEERIITSYEVLVGNPNDDGLLENCLKEHAVRTGRPPRVVASDRGYGSKRNDELCSKQGVKRICLPRKGKLGERRRAFQRQPWFRRYQRWRAGGEATISVLKRRFGLARSLSRGQEGTTCWVGFGIFAYNLRRMANLVE
jgi:IS5 family transposase